MTRDDAIAILRIHAPELRKAGIIHLSIFGSTVRGENGPASDIDILAALDKSRKLTLLDLVGLEERLGEILGTKVDLVQEGTLKEGIKRNIDAEAVLAF